jgi:biotin-dependent carboxylase-like uncharacterized protein
LKNTLQNTSKNIQTPNELGLVVTAPGMMSLVQDAGRFGAFNLGLTNGGPADALAFYWANSLCGNMLNSAAIEVSLGGLQLTAQINCILAVTGAPMGLTINGKTKSLWRSYAIKAGDSIDLGYASRGVRCYVAIKGGFDIPLSFASASTVCRESIGGLSGGKLRVNDVLPVKFNFAQLNSHTLFKLPDVAQPKYSDEVCLRTLLSCQHHYFTDVDQRLFFSSDYQVSQYWDRMGYRLTGQELTPSVDGILSEGICYGAVQIPKDGQPIVLLNDRQTIGGYPKIGAVISQDCAKLSQLREGDTVSFEPITMAQAGNLYHLQSHLLKNITLIAL